jgi:pilus assembly protein Flp/PilA
LQKLLTLERLDPPRGRGPEEGGVIAIRTHFRTLRADRRGATAIEYGLIAALIVIAMMTGLASLGGGVGGMWTKLSNTTNTYMP